jgi:hypothetical protein
MPKVMALALFSCSLRLLRTTASLSIPTSPTGTPEQISPRVEAEGQLSAVVIMHDCSGLGPVKRRPSRWAGELLRRGYVVVIPDSFTHAATLLAFALTRRQAELRSALFVASATRMPRLLMSRHYPMSMDLGLALWAARTAGLQRWPRW